MYFLLSNLLELLAAAVFLIPIHFLLHISVFHNGRKALCYCMFSLYLAAVYFLTGLPNITYVRFELNLNWIPFMGMAEDLKNSILNVLLFLPLGFALPLLCQTFRSGRKTVLFGLVLSLTVEVMQMFTFRATDINDLLTNTLGAALGYFAAALLMKRVPSVGAWEEENRSAELYLVCGITMLVMFLAQPFVLSVIWDAFMH